MEPKGQVNAQSFAFKKGLGQNFISDSNLLSAIVKDAQIGKGDTVVEIGAGAGALTKTLCAAAKEVFAYEIDTSLQSVLQKNLKECPNVTLKFADFLKVDIASLEKEIGVPYKVVANIPYYISTPLITILMEKTQSCLSLTLTVQKEVAERITAKSGKQYGVIALCVQSRAEVTIKRKIAKECFYPQPKVDSVVIHIVFWQNKLAQGDFFRTVVKAAFSSRRKALQNNLAASFNLSREKIKLIFDEIGVDLNCRAEQLSKEQFLLLAEKLKGFL